MPFSLRGFLIAILGLCVDSIAMARSLEQDVLAEINFARTHPFEYAQELRRYREAFDGRIVADERGEQLTFEGVRPVDEAIRFLEARRPLEPLSNGTILTMAAADHAGEQGRHGGRGHISPDGATPAKRVAQRGGGRYVSETIAYGRSDAMEIVRSLIVDDGVPSRMHRAVLFMPYLRYVGIACGHHATENFICVMDYSQTADGRPSVPPRLARSEVVATKRMSN